MVLRAAALATLSLPFLFAQSSTSPAPPAPSATADFVSGDGTTPAPLACPAGAPIGGIDLRVSSNGNSEPLPFQTIIHLSEGDVLQYAPVLRGREKRPGEVALVTVPLKRQANQSPIEVSDPKPADKAQRWNIPQAISLAAFVYGPQGLSKKKVEGFLSQDELLIAQLADYAEKTAQTEALVETLQNTNSSPASVNAALTGFASQYGLAVQIDKTAPPAVQAQTLFANLNPQLATYNPLASSTTERVGQTASVAAAAATLFFGSPIGLAAGGTAMLLDLRYIAFPGTQFRSSFAQTMPMPKGSLNLCGQRTPAPPHTRVAFIWAVRIPNAPVPSIRVGKADYLPAGQKTPLPVEVPDPQWKYLQRARAWTLEDGAGKRTEIPVLKLGNQKALELDLSKARPAPGDYHLSGYWDWTRFTVSGEIHVEPLSDFLTARLQPASQDRLLAKAGKIPVTVEGSDFEFVDKVEIKKLNDEFATAEPVRFVLPKGVREGPQKQMDVQVNTADLDPGAYTLLVTQQDGKAHEVKIGVLPNLPKIQNLPILANQGSSAQHYALKGERLQLLAKLEAPGVSFDLGKTSEEGTERNVTVQLQSDLKPGTVLEVQVDVADRSEPMHLPAALQITGPRPVIASSRLSLPAGIGIALQPEEFPAGYNLTALLDVKNVTPKSTLRVSCADDIGTPSVLHIGEQTPNSSLQQLSPDQLFLSLDTAAFPAGCRLQALVDNGSTERSEPFPLARMVRLPQIESFEAAGPAQPAGSRPYQLTGRNLEMIEKVGWDQLEGLPVAALPAPVPGQGQRQTLLIEMPDPPQPVASLCVWLRGESTASATNVSPTPPKSGAAATSPSPVPRTAPVH